MSIKKSFQVILALLILTSLVLTSCQPAAQPTTAPPDTQVPLKPAPTQPPAPTQAPTSAPTPTSAAPKSITITFYQEPDNLDPLYTQMWFSWTADKLFERGLWSIDDNHVISLEMATEVPSKENGGISADDKVITVKLRKDALWSDGEPVTAQDFIFTYQMYVDPKNTVQTRYPYDSVIDTVTAPDDYTLKIALKDPFVAWSTGMFRDVLPKHILEPVYQKDGNIDNADWNRNPTVGNGPYVLKEWVAASHMIFVANPKYWKGAPKIDQIFIRIVPDTQAQMAAIKAGETDIGAAMTASDVPTVKQLDKFKMEVVPSAWSEDWFFNLDPKTGHPALQDARVRQALVLAVDRQNIIDKLFYGIYTIPRTLWYDTPYEDTSIEVYPFDPAKAKSLLDEAGWVDKNGDGVREKDGKDLKLRYSTTSGNELREATQVVVQQMLKDVGVAVDIVNYSTDTLFASFGDSGPIALGDYDIAQWSDGAYDYPDPNWPYMLCSEIPTKDYPTGTNWYGICIPELDQLFQQQAVTTDLTARQQIFFKIEKIIHDQVLWVGLRTDPDLWVVNKNLKNLRLSAVDPFWNASEWDY